MVITDRTFDLSFLVRIHNLGVSKEKLRDGSGYQKAKRMNFWKTTKGGGVIFHPKSYVADFGPLYRGFSDVFRRIFANTEFYQI